MATRNPSLNNLPTAGERSSSAASGAEEAKLHGPRGAWWWTGKVPAECPGWDKEHGVLRALPLPTLHGFTRAQVLDYFDNTWTTSEIQFAALQGTDAFIRQPYHQLRHPMMFYYGHPAVLYINKFRVAGLLEDGIDLFFEQLFETGVDEMSWDDLSRGRDDWPPVSTVHAYRQKAYPIIRKVIETHPGLEPGCSVGWNDPCWAIFMGFEHERIHIETSSVLIRELPLSSVRKPEFWPDYHPSTCQPSPVVPTQGIDYPTNDLVPVEGQKVSLGKPLEYPSFGWDNEYGRRDVAVQSFSASRFKVTNGEFLEFVKAGGYSNTKYWSQEGWGWKTFRNVKWPTFWIPDGPQGLHRYKLRLLYDAVDMRWDWPADVNYHEAKAFCAWRTEQDGSEVLYRLITEAEHNLIRSARDRVDAVGAADLGATASGKLVDEQCNVDVCMQASGSDIAPRFGFNLALAYSSQNPVTELPASDKGFHDTLGNAWEWAEDHYSAFPGFKVHPFYEDFSSPCFAGKHQLILGGSFMSTGQLASKFARYQFRPHFFQHASFRVVAQEVDRSLYDMSRYGRGNPLRPFFETSCMDCAPPYVGDGPCCSVAANRRSAFTPTVAEGREQSQAKQEATQIAYESDEALGQYLAMHFGPQDSVYAGLLGESGLLQASMAGPRRLAEDLIMWSKRLGSEGESGLGRVLELGCAVGCSAFALTLGFDEVVGVDISARFIEVAAKMRENRRLDYDLCLEGMLTQRVTAQLDDDVDTERVRFIRGDACALPSSLGTFDAVLAANLLDCVPEPAKLLKQVAASLRPGGVAVIASPFNWSDKRTPRSNWIGAVTRDGTAERSAEQLQALVAQDFEVLAEDTVPFLVPEHSRMFQLVLSHRLVLKRK